MATQWLKEFSRTAKSTVHRYPAIKEKTKEATNSDPWGPTDTQKKELATAAYDDENRAIIFKALFKRADPSANATNHIFKALDLLEYFILMDVPETFQTIRVNGEVMHNLKTYNGAKHADAEKQERDNLRVRHKCTRVLDLMTDEELLADEREKVYRIATRMEGGRDANETPIIGSRSTTPPLHHTTSANRDSTPVTVRTPNQQSVGTLGARQETLAYSANATPPTALSSSPAARGSPSPSSTSPVVLGPNTTLLGGSSNRNQDRRKSTGLDELEWSRGGGSSAPPAVTAVKPTPTGFDPFAQLTAPPAGQTASSTSNNRTPVDFFATSTGSQHHNPQLRSKNDGSISPRPSSTTGGSSLLDITGGSDSRGHSTGTSPTSDSQLEDRMMAQLAQYSLGKAAPKPKEKPIGSL